MHQYLIYGLGIHSEIRLYNLSEQEVDCDVYVHFGEISEDIDSYVQRDLTSSMSPTRAWFRNDIAHFVISDGRDVLIQPIGEASENDLASFFLGWCIAFIFQQRNISAIHCSALEMDDQAILVAGFSGSGKSTTALSLIGAGCRYLADDIAMLDLKSDLMILPAFPQQKVCRNVAEKMEVSKLTYINEKKDKFAYYNTKDFCTVPRKLTTMFTLKPYDGDSVQIHRLKGVKKLDAVLRNLFLLDAYRAMGFTLEEKQRCLEIAGKIEIYEILRPKEGDTIDIIRDSILNIVRS